MRLADALARARALGVDRLDAQLLLCHRLGRPRGWLIAHDDESVPAATVDAYLRDAARRAEGEPLAYLTGEREFHGLALAVTPAVLVPRPETELLVDWALEHLSASPARRDPGPRVADLGTGSGAIALALRHHLPVSEVVAVDSAPEALVVAAGNAARLGLVVEFVEGSWWQPLTGRRFDLVVSNPPYIAAGDPHLAALTHEPSRALVSGADGLDALRVIVDGAPGHLEPGGWLLLEHGHDQGPAVRRLLEDTGFTDVQTRRDLAGHERCSGARRAHDRSPS